MTDLRFFRAADVVDLTIAKLSWYFYKKLIIVFLSSSDRGWHRVLLDYQLLALDSCIGIKFISYFIWSKPNWIWKCFFFPNQPQQGQKIGRARNQLRPCQASGSDDLGNELRAWPGCHHPDLGQAASRPPWPSSLSWARGHGLQNWRRVEVDQHSRVRTRRACRVIICRL